VEAVYWFSWIGHGSKNTSSPLSWLGGKLDSFGVRLLSKPVQTLGGAS
jgi:hypothetical protein